MRIPSARARRDMEAAADLRAQGAGWDTIGQKIGRHPTAVIRWTKHYREDWERLLREAEQRMSQQAGNESRNVLRRLLGHKSSRVRLSAADKLAKLRLVEKSAEPPPDPHANLSAFFARVEEMSDEELEEELADILARQTNHRVTENTEGRDTEKKD